MMLENVNYFRAEMMFLNMIRQNVIGELQHGEAAYIHDLRDQMNQESRGTGSWRTHHYSKSSGEFISNSWFRTYCSIYEFSKNRG